MIDIETFGLLPVGSITAICFLVGLAIKATETMDKWIPALCGAAGCILGLLWYFFGWPGLSAQEPITAAAIGIVSGLAATGVHQIGKQITER